MEVNCLASLWATGASISTREASLGSVILKYLLAPASAARLVKVKSCPSRTKRNHLLISSCLDESKIVLIVVMMT